MEPAVFKINFVMDSVPDKIFLEKYSPGQSPQSPQPQQVEPEEQKKYKKMSTRRAQDARKKQQTDNKTKKKQATGSPKHEKQTQKQPRKTTETKHTTKETTKMPKTCKPGVASGSPKISILHNISSNPAKCNLLSSETLEYCFILSPHPRL